MVVVLRDSDVSVDRSVELGAFHDTGGELGGLDLVAVGTRQLRAHIAVHDEGDRNKERLFGDGLANRLQLAITNGASAIRFGYVEPVFDPLKMRRQESASMSTLLRCLDVLSDSSALDFRASSGNFARAKEVELPHLELLLLAAEHLFAELRHLLAQTRVLCLQLGHQLEQSLDLSGLSFAHREEFGFHSSGLVNRISSVSNGRFCPEFAVYS